MSPKEPHKPIAPEQLAAWRELAERATAGPWVHPDATGSLVADASAIVLANSHAPVRQSSAAPGSVELLVSCRLDESSADHVAGFLFVADAEFAAAARDAVPALIDEVERLAKENVRHREALRSADADRARLSEQLDALRRRKD